MARFPGDEVVVLRDVSWREYQHRCDLKGEGHWPRMHYLDGVLELMTPSRGHGRYGAWVSRLVETWAVETGVELSAYGDWTLTDKLRRAGAEPDECYILGDDSKAPLERPHFVIEINWSRRGVDKLEIYRRLGVPEVWFWERDALTLYVLRGRKWLRAKRSDCLPGLDLEELYLFLDRPTLTTAIREFREHLQKSRRPRKRS
jgi:Uma2 family endonuclease